MLLLGGARRVRFRAKISIYPHLVETLFIIISAWLPTQQLSPTDKWSGFRHKRQIERRRGAKEITGWRPVAIAEVMGRVGSWVLYEVIYQREKENAEKSFSWSALGKLGCNGRHMQEQGREHTKTNPQRSKLSRGQGYGTSFVIRRHWQSGEEGNLWAALFIWWDSDFQAVLEPKQSDLLWACRAAPELLPFLFPEEKAARERLLMNQAVRKSPFSR